MLRHMDIDRSFGKTLRNVLRNLTANNFVAKATAAMKSVFAPQLALSRATA